LKKFGTLSALKVSANPTVNSGTNGEKLREGVPLRSSMCYVTSAGVSHVPVS